MYIHNTHIYIENVDLKLNTEILKKTYSCNRKLKTTVPLGGNLGFPESRRTHLLLTGRRRGG